jgi:hypothetical protein
MSCHSCENCCRKRGQRMIYQKSREIFSTQCVHTTALAALLLQFIQNFYQTSVPEELLGNVTSTMFSLRSLAFVRTWGEKKSNFILCILGKTPKGEYQANLNGVLLHKYFYSFNWILDEFQGCLSFHKSTILVINLKQPKTLIYEKIGQ